jgi:hypothetical protein
MTDRIHDIASLEKRVRRLEAIESIKEVIARYTEGADKRNDPAIMGPLFAENATWEAAGFGRYEGRETIAKSLADIAREQIVWSVHFMVLPSVSIGTDERTASCTWYLWELAKVSVNGAAARDTWLAIKYTSALIASDSGWMFESLKLNILLNSPVGEPWPIVESHD